MINNIWNKKIVGVPAVIIIIIQKILSTINNHIVTSFAKYNFNQCHKSIKIYAPFFYRFPSNINIGKNVIIGKGVEFSSELNNNNQLVLEDGVTIGSNCKIDFSGGIKIEENAHLGHNVIILTHDHGYDHNAPPKAKGLNIGNNAFIGVNCIITHNVSTIGKNSVLGAGSVLTKNIPDNEVFAGNPAKHITTRDELSK